MEFWGKRRIFGAFCILAVTIIVLVIYYACSDFGVEADFFKGTIRGELRLNTRAPEQTDEIDVALVKEFPPTNFAELLTSGNLFNKKDTSGTLTIPFEFEAPLGKFDALLAIWKAKGRPWSLRDIIGVYCNQTDELINIELTGDAPVAEGIELDIDLNRVKRSSSLSGRITFIGEWPANTEIIAMAILKEGQSISICNLPDIILLPTDPVEFLDYNIEMAPGTYPIILIVWQPEGAGLLDFKIIGGLPLPGVTIEDDIPKTGIDMIADFGQINN